MRESGNGGRPGMSLCRNGCAGYHSSGPTDGRYVGGGDPISGYPPHYCPCRDCCTSYGRYNSGAYSGGGPKYQLLIFEALENVNRSLSALSTLIENIAIRQEPRQDGIRRGMNNYIQEITDHIKRIITPEDASKLTNMAAKHPRLAMIEIGDRLDGMYQTLFYGIEGHAAQLSNEAARLSLYAAALSFGLNKRSTEPST
jgi:hypothetical protein